jgi:hypothetical protein
MQLSDIKTNVMQEMGISSEMYDNVISDFWRKLKELIQDAPNNRLGIRIGEFGTFHINYYRLRSYLKDWKEKAPEGQLKPSVSKIRYNLQEMETMVSNLETLLKTYKNEQKVDND